MKYFLPFLYIFFTNILSYSQNVTIDNYSINNYGQVELSIQGQAGKYYILHAQHGPNYNWAVSMTMGVNGTMVISEPAGAYPLQNYSITEHDVASPDDYDGDGLDDITELSNMPTDAPINDASSIAFIDGTTSIPDAQTFLNLATVQNVGWAPFLDDQLYVKFGILDRDTPNPKVYFINSNTHIIHANFWNAIGASVSGDDGSGEIVFNPNTISPNGTIGAYSFNFSFGNAYDFEATQRTYELLVANMPFLQNNMNHFIGSNNENNHLNNYAADFVGSRIEVALESVVFADVDYIPFHEAEGYGYFKHMTDLSETPGSRDIVLYDALPNSLPRVGGIITSVVQTPLSHVNLRAIQDNVPNSYISDPLSIDSIASLLGDYIYYKVENETFQIREATLAEVNAWYEDLRPTDPQIPIRDLSITEIKPLDSIDFAMSASFGAKCANIATMRTFGFPDGTIPDGFGIPFYYYHEFMLFNNFYQEAQVMLDNPTFQNDMVFRSERLKDFRSDIKDASMPQWMMDDLQAMHDNFPGAAVRCRSSTNNEDLPGFSGAGLYTSKTQHLDEGHISKSIKQIYASMWNFRAYEERDFYRVDHFMAAMGVLCHLNFEDEKSNGVGISIDPIYDTDGTFYLNSQVGESLITNPDPNTVPEEILLYQDSTQGGGYLVLNLSNLTTPGNLVMDVAYLNQLRDYLTVIHDEFEILYNVVGAEGFGMDIEYKVTAQDQLLIKQARPWVSFWADINGDYDLGVAAIDPGLSSSDLGNNEFVTATIANQGLNPMNSFDVELVIDGQSIETISVSQPIEPFEEADIQFSVPQDFSAIGDYDLMAIVSHLDDEYGNNDTLDVVLSKIHEYDGAISISELNVVCNDVVELNATINNLGDSTITDLEIQVLVNGLVIDTINASVEIPFLEQEDVFITIESNLQALNNDITLNLLSVNNLLDGDLTNNSVSTTTDLDSNYDVITLIINPDNYPEESSWKIMDESTNEIVSTGSLQNQNQYTEDICVNYSSCFSLYFYDSYGDGICCAYGNGNFQVLNSSGDVLVFNDGDFDHEALEVFCPDGTGCDVQASVNVTNISSPSLNDGVINIYTSSGLSPFQYSIDGGQTFVNSNSFNDLSPGSYLVVVQSAGDCSYQENVDIEVCEFISVDITSIDASSVVSTDGSIEINPTSGQAPYMYSIDGGQSFVPTNIFIGLPVGPYNIVVQDASNICYYVEIVPIEVAPLGLNDELLLNGINIYPNPTTNEFFVEIESVFSFSEDINIEVFDNLGRIIQIREISNNVGSKATISLKDCVSGTYFVRCSINSFDKYFKVLKL